MTNTNNVYERFEHSGVIIEIVQDDDPIGGPEENDNAGIIYSWARDFSGDETIGEPDLSIVCPVCHGEGTLDGSDEPTAPRYDQRTCENCSRDGYVDATLEEYFADQYSAALTIPLHYSYYGSTGDQIYPCDADNANAAIVFTQAEIDREWSGHIDPYPVVMKGADGTPTGEVREYGGARRYAEARVDELDQWLQGYVFGVVVRERDETVEDPENDDAGEVLESVWGFIGDPAGESGKYIYDEAKSMAESCAETIRDERAESYAMACRDIVTEG